VPTSITLQLSRELGRRISFGPIGEEQGKADDFVPYPNRIGQKLKEGLVQTRQL